VLFRPKEKFLILEIAPKGTSGLFLSIDENRALVFEKLEKKINIKQFLKSPVKNVFQKSWEGNYLFKSHRKIIAAVDPALATTIPVPLDLKRESQAQKGGITMVEFENLFARAMTMIFSQCRSEAARRINAVDIHTILIAAKARDFKVDDCAVQNPIGCSGKRISFLLELIFTKREIFEEFKPLFGAPEEFFFAESPQVRLVSIARVRRFPLTLIIAGDEAPSSLFVLAKAKGGHEVLYREKFAWSFSSVFAAIQDNFHVSGVVARELYAAYCARAMSAPAAKVFKKTIQPALISFFDEIKKSKVGGSVYVDAPYDMPFELPLHAAGVSIENVPASEILSEVDFLPGTQEFAERPSVLFRYLAPFFEAYFDKNNSEINQKLRRRLHWLAQ
jgi:hypothetical protein